MRRLFFLIVSKSLAVPAISQSKHPFTFEDMMKLKRVGEPEVSLDGKWVIFSVVDVDLDANTKTPHIWIVPPRWSSTGSATTRSMCHRHSSSSRRCKCSVCLPRCCIPPTKPNIRTNHRILNFGTKPPTTGVDHWTMK